jgi:hypothetical protein
MASLERHRNRNSKQSWKTDNQKEWELATKLIEIHSHYYKTLDHIVDAIGTLVIPDLCRIISHYSTLDLTHFQKDQIYSFNNGIWSEKQGFIPL